MFARSRNRGTTRSSIQENLPAALKAAGIESSICRGSEASPSAAGFELTPAGGISSFRGYADYMQTPEFAADIDESAGTRSHQARRGDVRRGCALALPPVAHCRCYDRTRNPRGTS